MDDPLSLRLTLIVQQAVSPMLALGMFVRGWFRGRDRADRATYAALAFSYVAFGAVVGRWDVVSTTLRSALVVAVTLGSIVLVGLSPAAMAAAPPQRRRAWGGPVSRVR